MLTRRAKAYSSFASVV